MTSSSEFYVRPDGMEDAEWMRPHREMVDSLPLSDDDKRRLNDALDAVYSTTIEQRTEEHEHERQLLRTLLRGLQEASDASEFQPLRDANDRP